MQGYESKRGARTRRILPLISLGIWLQARPVLPQTTDLERYPKGPGTSEGEPERAARELGSLDSLSQTTEDERYQKALADFRAGKLEQAARELRVLDSAVARNALGVVLETMGDHGGALGAFQDALRLQPDFAGAAYNAAKLLIREGRPAAAISQLQSTLQRHRQPDEAAFSLQMLLVEAYASLGQNQRAVAILEELSKQKPDSAKVHFYLAMAYVTSELFEAAAGQYREGLRLEPKNGAGLMGYAKALLKLKKSSQATPYLQEYVRLKPDDAEGHYYLGRALRDTGRLKEAIEELSQAARLSPEDYFVRYHLGMALWEAGRPQEALPHFTAAERLNPDDIQAHSSLARVLRALGKEEEARKESEAAERLGVSKSRQDQASFHIARGNLFFEHGDFKAAAGAFRQSLELDPQNARAHYNLGLVLDRLNDPQGAQREFAKAIALDPKLALAYNAEGALELKSGHITKAQAAFQQAIRVDPQYAEAKNSLGTLYAKLGRNAEAVSLFREAVEDSPDYPQPYLNWGLVLASQGDLSRAKEMFEKALRLSPNLPEARKALQMVEETLKGQH